MGLTPNSMIFLTSYAAFLMWNIFESITQQMTLIKLKLSKLLNHRFLTFYSGYGSL